MTTATAVARQDRVLAQADYNLVQIFWIFVGVSLLIAAVIALYCIHKGGSVQWSTRFGLWVQVACSQ